MYNKRKNKYKNVNIMNKYTNLLTVLRGLADNPLIASLLEYSEKVSTESFNDFLSQVYSAGAEENLLSAVQKLILCDVNAFSKKCAEGGTPSKYLEKAYTYDLKIIFSALGSLSKRGEFRMGKPLSVFNEEVDYIIYDLEDFYRKNGCGQFIENKAFYYDGDKILPITNVDGVTLSGLKNYAAEKSAIVNNVEDFLNGLPFSHMLLYGDRGTGKSSTVHAVLNKYGERGLRLIEIEKRHLGDIGKIRREVAFQPLKFIIFIDDLTLSEQDEKASSLKAAIEGSVSGGNNVMIVATSNRRHILRENLSDRENSIHPTDSMEEQLSLSDRFGLTVMFSSTDKAEYLSIVRQLAADKKLTTPTAELEAYAERWALEYGVRSPRRAKQFVDFAYACEKSNRKIEF